MKVQINVDEQFWRKARVTALERGWTLGELVEESVHSFMDNKGVVERKLVKIESKVPGDDEVRVQPPKPVDKPKVDQKTCKHSYVALPEGGMGCFKCGYKTT